jgi:PAS domain S-box-containing protein
MKKDMPQIDKILEILGRYKQTENSHPGQLNGEERINLLARELQTCMSTMEVKEQQLTAREIQFGNTLDKMLEGMQIISFDWRYLYVNDSLARQSRHLKEELIGHTMMEMFPGIETTDVFHVLKRCMERRIPEHIETEFVYPDNTKAWFELSIQPVTEGISVLSVDVTARKKVEEKLKASEQEYRSLIEQATDGIFISDETGKYIDVNLSACKMLGYSKEELLTMRLQDVLLEEELKDNPPRFDELIAGKTVLSRRNLRRKNGAIIPVEINAKMLSTGKMLGMVRDISERRQAEERLRASEEKFRRLTETAFDAIVLVNEPGNIIFWNRGAELMFGYSVEEVIHKSLTMIMPEKFREAHQRGMERYIRTGEKRVIGRVVELEGRRKNGEVFPIEISITAWDSAEGKMFSGIIRDIHERKEAEEKILKLNEDLERKVAERTAQLERKVQQLKESEEKFQKAFQVSAAGITITRLSDSHYLDVNDAFVEMTGFDRDELIGHTSTELGMIVDFKQREEVLRQIKESGAAKHFEMTVRNKQGRMLQVLSSVETIVLGGEKYAINIIYDITERKQAEEQLEAVNKELEAFSYSVSHDLRAPLRSIIGYSQMFEEDFADKVNDEGKRLLGVIRRNADKMNNLIDDLLEFSRLGKMGLQKLEVDMKSLVENALAVVSNAVNHHARVTINTLLPVCADQDLMFQVWINLLSNAVKYSSKKSDPQIEIGSHKERNEIIYYVRDNGAGFDMQYAEKLFGVFQRLHRASEFEGTGVGLSIVKRIISKHGGRVWAEGKVGEGATFYFSLPDFST